MEEGRWDTHQPFVSVHTTRLHCYQGTFPTVWNTRVIGQNIGSLCLLAAETVSLGTKVG